jgi:hypothetical protein
MRSRIATIARFTMLEALRTRFPMLVLLVLGIALAASFFVREIAITESGRYQTAFYAATIRLASVFVAALYTIASVSREFQDKGLDVMLALDVPRSHYVAGKLLGLLAIGSAVAVVNAVPLIPLAGMESAAQWTLSLAWELAVVVALALFCVVTFTAVMPAASFVIAFYVLARALTAIRLLSANPLAGGEALSQRFMNACVEGLAWIVPAIDRWTQTSWLVDQRALWIDIAGLTGQSLAFVVVLAAATVFDMQRKNF